MLTNLSEYFLPEQQFYLDIIDYKRIEQPTQVSSVKLKCEDTINTTYYESSATIKITLIRKVSFDPDVLFNVSIAFSSVLAIHPDKKDALDWKSLNLAAEFKENGDFVLNNLLSRTTLLLGQITSSYGLPPLIIPSKIINN